MISKLGLMTLGGALRYCSEINPPDERVVADYFKAHPYVNWQALGPHTQRWAENGFPSVEIGHKLAASLMTTSFSAEVVRDYVRLPWDSFLITVPDQLLSPNEHLLLVTYTDNRLYYAMTWEDDLIVGAASGPLWTLTHTQCEDDKASRTTVSTSEYTITKSSDRLDDRAFVDRIHDVIGKLVVGVCAKMQTCTKVPSQAHHVKNKSWPKNTTRNTTVFKLIENVKLDVRVALREHIEKGGASPSVQSLVRGHWKLQVCGDNRASRKLIHVEPYWRGPESAPVAVRAHTIENV